MAREQINPALLTLKLYSVGFIHESPFACHKEYYSACENSCIPSPGSEGDLSNVTQQS